MATTFLAATPIQDTFLLPGTNTPGNGVQLFCYAAGSSTKTTVYKDNAGATPWTNPIVLDSGGNIPSGGEVWQTQGQSMKYVYAPSNDTDPPASPYRTLDNMPGTNDVTAQTGVEWLTGPTPTFVSGTQFTLVGDQTATFTKGRRVKTTNTGGTVYSTIVGSTFGALTTVNIVNDASTLDAGLSAVSYGLFDPANLSISPSEVYRKGANVASAANATTDIWGIVGDYVHITGGNQIRNFSTAPYAGLERTVIFDAALTLFSSAAITIPGNTNVTTAANDRATVRAESVSTAIITQYTRAGLQVANVQTFTSNGTYTPTAGMRWAKVTVVGGGGAGGGAVSTGVGQVSVGSGGAAAAAAIKYVSAATVGASTAVTIGPGGSAISGAAGTAGSTSSFGAICSATGGPPGNTSAGGANVFSDGVAGASSSVGDINIVGGASQAGIGFSSAPAIVAGGKGGDSILGGGAPGKVNGVGIGALPNTGGGGGGAGLTPSAGALAGGAGASGLVVIEEYFQALGTP